MKKVFLLLLILGLLFVTSCSGSDSRGGSSSESDLDIARHCLKIDLYKCDDFTPHGTVTNNCTDEVSAAKIVITGYSEKGVAGDKVDADEEYVEDIQVGDEKDFEAVFSTSSKGKIKSCKAVVEDGYLK